MRQNRYVRTAVAVALLLILGCASAFAAGGYFARYKYSFSAEAIVSASAAVPPEEMNETAADIYRLGFAAGFDQALGNNVVYTNSDQSPFVAYPADGTASARVWQDQPAVPTSAPQTYIVNKSSKAFHYPACSGAQAMKEANKIVFVGSREELIEKGYHPCGNCQP